MAQPRSGTVPWPTRARGAMPRAARRRALGAVAPATPRPRRPAHLPGLDGLRGLAVAAVVVYHLGYLRGGFLGVDLFFVLSGFLISRLLVAEREATGRISLRGFWARRARRLLPALFLTVVAVLVAAREVLASWRLGAVRDDALATLAYVANWRLVASGQSYFSGDASPLRHAWSLAVEEQFYLLWPLVAVAAFAVAGRHRRAALGLAALAVAAASIAWMWTLADGGADADRLYFGTDTRIFAMALGGAAGVAFDPLRRLRRSPREPDDGRWGPLGDVVGLVGLAGLTCAVVAVDLATPRLHRGGFAAVAGASVLAVLGAAWGGRGLRWLRWAPLRHLGARSYGIYLYSWPLQVLLEARFPLWGRHRLAAVTVVTTLLLAEVSFALVEQPVVTGRPPLARRFAARRAGAAPRRDRPAVPRRRWGPVATVAALALVLGAVWSVGRSATPEPDYLRVSDRAADEAALAAGGFGHGGPAPPPSRAPLPTGPLRGDDPIDPGEDPPFDPLDREPVRGPGRDPASVFGRPLRIAVFGDSVAWSFSAGMDRHVAAPVQIANRSLIGCGILPPAFRHWTAGGRWQGYRDACGASQAEAERLGLASGPDVVLLWFGAWEVLDHRGPDGTAYEVGDDAYGELLRTRVQERVNAARARGIPTAVPLVPCFVPAEGSPNTPMRTSRIRRDWVNDQIRRVAARNPGWVRLIEPAEVLCDGDEARREVDGLALREDGAHFTRATAIWFWDTYLAAAVAETFPAPPAGGAG